MNCWLCYLVLFSYLVFITGFQAPSHSSNWQELASTTRGMLSMEVILVETVCLIPRGWAVTSRSAHVTASPGAATPAWTHFIFLPSDSQLQVGLPPSSLRAKYITVLTVSPSQISVQLVVVSPKEYPQCLQPVCNLSLPRGMALGMVSGQGLLSA